MQNSPWASPKAGKFKRQIAILEAAEAIMRRSGEAGFTMQELAEQAGVSLATPYNLFGSKLCVQRALYHEQTSSFRAYFEAHASQEPLQRIFDFIDFSFDRFRSDQNFHKATLGFLSKNPGGRLGRSFWEAEISYIGNLVQAAEAAGCLRAQTPTELVALIIVRGFRSIGQEWIYGTLNLDEAHEHMGATLTMLLSSLVQGDRRDALTRIASKYSGAFERQTPASD